VAAILEEVANEVRESGQTPYVVSIGGSITGWSMTQPLGAIAYLDAFIEAVEQTGAAAAGLTHIVHATGSGSTQAGLALGAKSMDENVRVIGISVSESREVLVPIVKKIGRETADALKVDAELTDNDIIIMDEYVKGGYGTVDKNTAEAIRLLFKTEGIVLDPVYTGKAMAALLDLLRKGFFRKEDRVVFIHTGGTPALFPYRKPLLELLG
jgi:1-aminocyclopropane-1-carboxylate deaminase/D-cysteine desulfhydrase-like pyridoxal-dependent ACC family enzyme